ncbi:unnamed protein product, partial [Timema podura]|nr:unnamed protein product [Timema podura]
MYLYPQFEELNWYAGQHLLQVICNTNIVGAEPRKYLMQGIRALIPMLKMWLTKNECNRPFPSIVCQNLIRDLKRELKIGERNAKMLNPPAPGRESKRQRKKTFDTDFHYFSAANKLPRACDHGLGDGTGGLQPTTMHPFRPHSSATVSLYYGR